MKYPKRGDVFWVNLDPTVGTEVKKARPGLVISNDLGNRHAGSVIVIPITSQTKRLYSFEAELSLPKKRGKALCTQLRCVDKQRLGARITSINATELIAVEDALRVALSL